jgi:hypothetical protein
MGLGGQRHAQAALLPGKGLGTLFTGGWVGPTVNLNGYGKSRPYWDSIP